MASSPDLNGSADLTVEGEVAEVRMARPDKSNAVTVELVEDLFAIIDELETRIEDGEVYSIVLTHEGGTFCAGYDLNVIAGDDATDEERAWLTDRFPAARSWFRNVDVPVVVGATGPAVAAGAGWALVGDIVVVGPEFRIWWPEINVGLFPHTMGPSFVERVGVRRAAELVFLGRHAKLAPEEAREVGFVNRIVDADEVDAEAREIGDILADHEREYGYMLDAYELFNIAKREVRSAHNGGHALGEWRGTYDRWFSGEGPRLGGKDDPRKAEGDD